MFKLRKPLEKGHKKLINAWAMYDWANSVYVLVISSTIFPIYYASLFVESNKIPLFGYEIKNTAAISFITAAAFVLISTITPILSGIADYISNRKIFMKFFVYMGALSCIGMYWFDLENIYWGLFLYFLALIGYWISFAFSNSYLPDIAHPHQQDKASAKGYALGYVGSVLLLLFNLAMVMQPEWFGIQGGASESAMKAMRYSFISVGIWWILFSQYSFYYLPKGNHESGVVSNFLTNGFKELRGVTKKLGTMRNLKNFLYSFFIYSVALQTVFLVATYFGEEEIIWNSDSEKTIGLIVSILIIQLIGIIGAILTAAASKRFGNVLTLIVINFIWAGICVLAFFIRTPLEFYITAGMVGMVMGGLQALSRSTYSKLLPKTQDTASFFSFYDVTEKIAIVIGMSLFGIIDQITGSMRNSVLLFVLFFLIGALLLFRIPKRIVGVQ